MPAPAWRRGSRCTAWFTAFHPGFRVCRRRSAPTSRASRPSPPSAGAWRPPRADEGHRWWPRTTSCRRTSWAAPGFRPDSRVWPPGWPGGTWGAWLAAPAGSPCSPRGVQLLNATVGLPPPAPPSCGLALERFSETARNHDKTRACVLLVEPTRRGEGRPRTAAHSGGPALEHLANEFGSRDRVNFHGVASDQEVLDFCAVATSSACSAPRSRRAWSPWRPWPRASPSSRPTRRRCCASPTRPPRLPLPARCRVVGALADPQLLGDPAARRSLGAAGLQSVAGNDRHRTLAALEALCLHAAGASRP